MFIHTTLGKNGVFVFMRNVKLDRKDDEGRVIYSSDASDSRMPDRIDS